MLFMIGSNQGGGGHGKKTMIGSITESDKSNTNFCIYTHSYHKCSEEMHRKGR